MKTIKYIVPALMLGLAMTACHDDDNYGVLDGVDMINRSQSIAEGATVRPSSTVALTLSYNNLVAIADRSITVNGQAVTASVNPDNGMELVIPLALTAYTEYTVEVPEGAVCIKDNPEVFAPAKTVKFNTNVGLDRSQVAASLINPNATAEAKKLYTYLVENYGKTQLSGAMGEVAWGTRFSDFIAQQAGKYPAVVGFDYIHLANSPSDWIDYGDITPVQQVWDAGSIPAFTWHWNTPVSFGTPIDETVSTAETVMLTDWSASLQLTDETSMAVLSKVSAGSVITVTVKDVAEGAQGSFKDSGWSGLVAADGTDYDYFVINGDFSITLDAVTADKVREGGIIIGGHDYTLVSVKVYSDGAPSDELDAKGDFNAANALVAGTPENKVLDADIDKVAGYLKLLQDAGIPVIWRPFHEAAGDYTWGAWFWWGMSGVDTTKQLWDYLYDKLTNEYGINNLIWVWTVQTTDEGKLASIDKLQAAYPGNDKVDIVCADLYIDDAMTDQTDTFDLINILVDKKKVIALGEVGNMVDPVSAYNNGALWSWFMQWYEMGDNADTPQFDRWNNAEIWREMVNSPYVVSRGDFSLK